MSKKCQVYDLKTNVHVLDAFPRSSGDHLAQNFSRKIKLIYQLFFI
jgi:hypothetical protein